ncbi:MULTISPECIES: glycosyltransferase family 4 protein [unclassified Chryseobacterium]|uniref:glycosyltransferase family 4 protein n=1 Tax=unclassified Chryseobacterium TaxID=2593645 RepID=UPI000B244685|nr:MULTISPECIES: glycosyltransferase family 4 protein [unclassified Chryseobacterium]
MKIMFYFNSMAPAGGIERVISKHIKFLALENEVILLTNDSKPSFYDLPNNIVLDNIEEVSELNMKSRVARFYQIFKSIFRSSSKLRNKIKLHKPEVIYVASPLNLLKIFLANKKSHNLLVTEHASFNAYNLIYKLIVRILYGKVGLLTVPTIDDSKFYDSIGISNIYLPNPLSFYPSKHSTLDSKIVLNVGRFTEDKQHHILIKSWKLTNQRINGWKLHIYGKGENEQEIKRLIEELDLAESVFIFPPTKAIEEKFIESSIFALSSRTEGFGLVLAEAMACGVPCVSFDCPTGPKDIILNEVNGLLIEQNNKKSFAEALDILMSDRDLRIKYGAQARLDIKKFDEKIVGYKLNDLINKNFKKN